MISSLIRAFNTIVSTSWNVNTAVYASLSKSVSAQDTTPVDLAFSSDGTKMFIMGQIKDTVYQYTLSTPWNVSTATYASLSKSVSAQAQNPQGLAFSSDGTKMYIADNATGKVFQYTLSTPWNVSTATYDSLSKTLTNGGQDIGLYFSPDGTKMYHGNINKNGVSQYNLSTPWNVSTASFFTTVLVSPNDTTSEGFAFSSDGTKMFIMGQIKDTVYQYTLSTPWNVSTATYDSLSKSVSAQDTTPSGLAFSSDGTKMFITGTTTDTVYQYTL